MKRKARKFPIDNFISSNQELLNSRIEIRIDEEYAEDIINFLTETKKNGKPIRKHKFGRILYVVLSGNYSKDLYAREEVSQKAKDVTAMKFKGKGNHRIVCKEIRCENKKVVMVVLFHKKSQKNTKKEIAIYEKVGAYDYEC